jgi:cytochrome c oxidase subunit IV
MSQHVIPPKTYYIIFAVLLVLLVLTVVAAEFDFGAANLIIAMAIAGAKAVLIVLYFMHIRYSLPIVQIAAVTGVLWLVIAGTFTMADYLTRGWIELPADEGPAPVQPERVDRIGPRPPM